MDHLWTTPAAAMPSCPEETLVNACAHQRLLERISFPPGLFAGNPGKKQHRKIAYRVKAFTTIPEGEGFAMPLKR
jgi:hypothetical protein